MSEESQQKKLKTEDTPQLEVSYRICDAPDTNLAGYPGYVKAKLLRLTPAKYAKYHNEARNKR
jgi:hypothetical protein